MKRYKRAVEKFSIISTITLVLVCFTLISWAQNELNRKTYYKAIASKNLQSIQAEIDKIKNIKEYNGYEGALLMRQAGLVSGLTKKYNYFKTGAEQLDKAITENPENSELKFLRLMIQEQAPALLNYNDNIDADSKEVKKHFESFSSETKKAIIGYCDNSKILKKEDFKI